MSLEEFHSCKSNLIVDNLFGVSNHTLFDEENDEENDELEEIIIEKIEAIEDDYDDYGDDYDYQEDTEIEYYESKLLNFKAANERNSFEVRNDLYRRNKNKNKKEKIRRKYFHFMSYPRYLPRYRVLLPEGDSPSIDIMEYKDGTKIWFFHDEYHRLDGPAWIHDNGDTDWYINDYYVTSEITEWAKTHSIDLDNLTDVDKALIKIVWADYDGK